MLFVYRCTDGVEVEIPRSIFSRSTQAIEDDQSDWPGSKIEEPHERPASTNQISYEANSESGRSLQAVVSETHFNRDMSRITKETAKIRTLIFPSTVREVLDPVFAGNMHLKSVILNEGLERLGQFEDGEFYLCGGVFGQTQLQNIMLPSTLRVLGDYVFDQCYELEHVTFREGNRLEELGAMCFSSDKIEAITLPGTLKKLSNYAFSLCNGLKRIYVEDGWDISFSSADFVHATVILPRKTTVQNRPLWELRELK